MVNVLLAISVLRPEAAERHTQLKGPGAEPTTPPRRAHRENADRGGRELPDRGGGPPREFLDRQHYAASRWFPAAGPLSSRWGVWRAPPLCPPLSRAAARRRGSSWA